MAARAIVSFDLPDRKPKEPDLTDNQRSFIEHLLEEVDAKGVSDEYVGPLGKWQASTLIERLIELRDGVVNDRVTVKRREQQQPEQSLLKKSFPWLFILALIIVVAFVFGV